MERARFFGTEDDRGGDCLRTEMFGSLPISSPSPDAAGVGLDGGANYITHTVTKFDTLAGVAIKYGVEVTDIKKLNGLVTDLQMFALKTLQIPLAGKHPPPILPNGHETPARHQSASSLRYSDKFDSFQSLKLKASSEEKISPALSTLRDYYGLKPVVEDQNGGAHYPEDIPFTKSSPPISSTPFSHHRKSKSVANCLASQNGDFIDRLIYQEPENDSEKLVRRRQKSVADFSKCNDKGLAIRAKSSNRGALDGETGGPNPVHVSYLSNGVRRSCSTSNLQDSEDGGLSSLWNLKPDFQALSAAAITRPIFDGLPKPARKNKAALD